MSAVESSWRQKSGKSQRPGLSRQGAELAQLGRHTDGRKDGSLSGLHQSMATLVEALTSVEGSAPVILNPLAQALNTQSTGLTRPSVCCVGVLKPVCSVPMCA